MIMIEALSALSLYRQLEALEENLRSVKDDSVDQFMAAYKNQGSFNHILNQITEQAERIADLKDWHLTGFFNFSLTLDPTNAPLILREMGSNDIYALTLEEK